MSLLGSFGHWLCRLVITGERFILQGPRRDDPLIFENRCMVDPPPLPACIPEHMLPSLMTRSRIANERLERPIVMRGILSHFDEAKELLKDGFRKVSPGYPARLIRPTVLVTGFGSEYWGAKMLLLEMLQQAGAARVYLTQYCMVHAVGSEWDVVNTPGRGLLALELDWMEYSTVAYADSITEASHPIGLQDLLDELAWYLLDQHAVVADEHDLRRYLAYTGLVADGELPVVDHGKDWPERRTIRLTAGELADAGYGFLRRLCSVIAASLEDLTDEQMTLLVQQGISLFGDASDVRGLDALLTKQLAIPVTRSPARHSSPTSHPALRGLSVYAENLEQWRPQRPARR